MWSSLTLTSTALPGVLAAQPSLAAEALGHLPAGWRDQTFKEGMAVCGSMNGVLLVEACGMLFPAGFVPVVLLGYFLFGTSGPGRNAPMLQTPACLPAHSAVQQLLGADIRAGAAKCDVTKKGEVERLVSWTVKQFGGVDILVANAGMRKLPVLQ